jgi:2-amino-4-hydroxy-6-hydroxymethyldihydropteridine diphosphokinase
MFVLVTEIKMVILGLGSNLGDRLAHLRHALSHIKSIPDVQVIRVSPVYISEAMLPEHSPADWNVSYFNLAIACKTNLSPLSLLKKIKEIESTLGRKPAERWAPRVIDIDILTWNNETCSTQELTIPHVGLLERPFALWPLADIEPLWQYPISGPHEGKTAAELIEKWGSRFAGNSPFSTKQIHQRIDTPELVGIINVTPDSFSDGGKCQESVAALQQAKQLVLAGATILDIGAESTAPNTKSITAEEEWLRLEPILAVISQEKKNFLLEPKISIDTRHDSVAKRAMAYNINWITRS